MSDTAAAAPFQFHVGRAAMIGAGVMVCVTGFTTGSGLLDIVGLNYLYIVVMATIAIQLILTISAWFLGQELARYVLRSRLGPGIEPPSAPLTAVTGLVFLVTFFLSFFMAFSFWYNQFYRLSQQAEEARNLPNSFQSTVMKPLREAVEKRRESELREPYKDPAVGPWLTGIDTVITAAQGGQGRDAIQKGFEERNKSDQDRQNRLKANETQRDKDAQISEKELFDLRKQKASNEAELDEINRRLEPIDEALTSLKKQKDDLNFERSQQCSGGGGRKVGCGPKANLAGAEMAKVAKAIAKLEADAKPDRIRRAKLEQNLSKATVRISQLTAKQDAAGSSEPVSKPVTALPPSLTGIDAGVNTLRDRKRGFLATGTLKAYEETAKACTTILQILTDAKVPALTPTAVSCESSGVLQQVQTRPQREQARKDFETNCAPEKMTEAAAAASRMIPLGQEGVARKILGESFQSINVKIQSCINFAQATGADVTFIEAERARSARDNSPDRDRFDQAWNGFWSGGGHSTMAKLLAGVFDLLILGLSFFADLFNIRGRAKHTPATARRVDLDLSPNAADSMHLASVKALCRLARYDIKLRRYAIDPNGPDISELDPDLRSDVLRRLDSQLQSGRAEPLKDGRRALSDAGLGELETFIHAEMGPVTPKAGRSHARTDLQSAPLPSSISGAVSPNGIPERRGAGPAAGGHRQPTMRPRPPDLGASRWMSPPKRPVQGDIAAAAAQAPPSPDRRDTPSRPADGPSPADDDAYGIAGLMNRR